MQIQELAAFVRRPRRIEELQGLHLVSNEHPFAVVATVELGKIDYENFTTDLLADRWFIRKYASLCYKKADAWYCLLVRKQHHKDGILIMPQEDNCHIGWAAYFPAQIII